MAENFNRLLYNRALWAALAGWFVAQSLKVLTYWGIEKKFDLRRFFGSGGMPSSHTASVVALTIMVGGLEGFGSTAFAISFVFMTIVMYDATGVRRETGTQAKILNKILRSILLDGKSVTDQALKELVGHTPVEVFGGAVVGIIVGVLFLP